MSYVPSKCGCAYEDGEQTRWCAHHVSGMQETIVARERSITDLRYMVRGLEGELAERNAERDEMESERNATIRILRKQKKILAQWLRDRSRERDEWKAKAEAAIQGTVVGTCDWGYCDEPTVDLRYSTEIETWLPVCEQHRTAYKERVAEIVRERDEWKAKAERQAPRKVEPPKLRPSDDLLGEPDTHYCCYHMRWETPKGEKV